MGIDDRVISAMQPGELHAVTEISEKIGAEYSRTFFALSRLLGFGFVDVDQDNYWWLTVVGEKLRRVLLDRDKRNEDHS